MSWFPIRPGTGLASFLHVLMQLTEPVLAVVMGVSGSGKTTASASLSAALGCQFQETMICTQ